MSDLFQSLITWISLHPGWASAVIFSVALTESLAVVGLLVPGVMIMFGIGALISIDAISFWPTMIWAVLGAVTGDGLSFWLGRHYRETIRQRWPFNRYPGSIDQGTRFFQRYGGKSVALGRFFGPVRAIIPLVAGMLGMPPMTFLIANILSALVWAPVYLLPGIAFGTSLELASEVALRLVILIILMAVLIWGIIRLIRLLFRLIQPHSKSIVQALLNWGRKHPKLGSIASALADPHHPEARSLSLLATLLVLASGLFILITGAVLKGSLFASLDPMIWHGLQSLRTPWMDQLMVFITRLGNWSTLLLVGGVMILYSFSQQHLRTPLYWLAALAFALLSAPLLKHGLQIPRPENSVYPADSFSFPSGHTLNALCLYGFASVIGAWSLSPRWRWIAYALAGVLVTGVAFSRLYLGVHWFSDILGSITLGLTWTSALGIAYRRHSQPETSWPRMLGLLVATLGLSLLIGNSTLQKTEVERYRIADTPMEIPADSWWNRDSVDLPTTREDLREFHNHPLNLQYSGDVQALTQALAIHGWKPAPELEWQQLLRILAAHPKLGDTPILPQVHAGRHESLILTREMNPEQRLVIRLWLADRRLMPGETPLWIGNVSTQHLTSLLGWLHYAKTDSDFNTPLRILVQDLQTTGTLVFRQTSTGVRIRKGSGVTRR